MIDEHHRQTGELANILKMPPRLVDREPLVDCHLVLGAHYEDLKRHMEFEAAVHGARLR